ncbi:MAG: glutamate--tRNA ligase [Candidatus Poribacteria bacterium]|nr:glutamate--tRNA ligase [Candidatus Poribacteria bacterium]
MVSDKPVRVRFAPSPTGSLHIGGARTALFNWLFARHFGGKFILRIDDTDESRSSDESTRSIYELLEWLGLTWDEGPIAGGDCGSYIQSERQNLYQEYVHMLLDSGDAYCCYCTADELKQMRENAFAEGRQPHYAGICRHLTEQDRSRLNAAGRKPTVRLKISDSAIIVRDLVQGDVTFEADALDDFIIVKSNGYPLYNFTSAIDDHEMGISHVIRGKDHLSNTPKQILICHALGFELPVFAHLPLVLGSSKGEKLSKRRHGDLVAVGKYREDGYLPEAMINFLVRLGWSYDDKSEIFSLDELVEKFNVERIGRSEGVFDINKLQWLNKTYIMNLDLTERTNAVLPFLRKSGLLETDVTKDCQARLEKIVESVGDRMTTLADIADYGYFFTDNFDYDPRAIKKWWKGGPAAILQGLREVLKSIEVFEMENIETAMWYYLDEKKIKRIRGMQPLRIALTGVSGGPGLFDIIALLGREKVVERLDRAINYIQTAN